MRFGARRAHFCLLLLVFACPLSVRTQGFHYAGNSPREFVEHFYKWYVPLALNDQTSRSWEATLKLSPPPFSLQLAELLRADAAAQAKCKELVGLDFDPFLYTQDPAERYVVGGITHTGHNYKAQIYSVDHGVRSKEPDVIAAFGRQEGHWMFVNFYYLNPKGDLLAALKTRSSCSEPRVPAGK